MVKDIRVTYRKRHSYNTPNNRIRVVKSPGGRLLAHYLSKRAGVAKCGDTGKPLHGIPRARPKAFARLPQHKRTVSRAYGGNLSHAAVRERILRAFIVEEQKIVKKVLTEKAKSSKASSKGAAATSGSKKGSSKK